mmetsp:Transcript_131869/g.367633  ORF Transcript_131869/g.367633 Transcript_131869/m.367633 type:complete len:277 (+) Transcript_131869:442-1272(+)
MACCRVRTRCVGWILQHVRYAASSTFRAICEGSKVLRVTSRRQRFTYSLHMSMISVSCCSSRTSFATDRGMDWSTVRKIWRTSLNFPSFVSSLCASLTRSRIFATVNKITGVGSFDLKLPSVAFDRSGQLRDCDCGSPGRELHVAQKASLKSGSKGAALMIPSLRFKRPRASSNSPAATRSAGSLRFFSHLTDTGSAMATVRPLLSAGDSSGSSLGSMPRSRSRPPSQSPPPPPPPPSAKSSSSAQALAPRSVSSGFSSASAKGDSFGGWLATCAS